MLLFFTRDEFSFTGAVTPPRRRAVWTTAVDRHRVEKYRQYLAASWRWHSSPVHQSLNCNCAAYNPKGCVTVPSCAWIQHTLRPWIVRHFVRMATAKFSRKDGMHHYLLWL